MHFRTPHIALALIAMLTLGACGDDTPVTPGKDPLIFSGELAAMGFEPHLLNLERAGTVHIELTELRALFVRVADPENFVLRIGVGVGRLNEDGECVLSIRPTFFEGLRRTVLLSREINCLAVFDNRLLPDEAVVAYVVTVEDGSKS